MKEPGSQAPELTFELAVPGDVCADREIEVTAAMLSAYARAVGAPAGTAAFLAPASWAIPRVSFTRYSVPHGGIHARQSWRNLRPVRAGETLRLRTTVRDKYVAKGKPYLVFASVIEDGAGQPVGRGEMAIVWPK